MKPSSSDRQVVYVQDGDNYLPRTSKRPERRTLYPGTARRVAGEQVVTGSFFIDAEYKMKGGK
jgi:hypothetical protein